MLMKQDHELRSIVSPQKQPAQVPAPPTLRSDGPLTVTIFVAFPSRPILTGGGIGRRWLPRCAGRLVGTARHCSRTVKSEPSALGDRVFGEDGLDLLEGLLAAASGAIPFRMMSAQAMLNTCVFWTSAKAGLKAQNCGKVGPSNPSSV